MGDAQKVLLGGDLNAMQDYLRSMHRASVNEALDQANRSSDAQRVDATVPRDSVQLYRKLHSMGLQYGPAFQLLQTSGCLRTLARSDRGRAEVRRACRSFTML